MIAIQAVLNASQTAQFYDMIYWVLFSLCNSYFHLKTFIKFNLMMGLRLWHDYKYWISFFIFGILYSFSLSRAEEGKRIYIFTL
jgi:hypothetical protein